LAHTGQRKFNSGSEGRASGVRVLRNQIPDLPGFYHGLEAHPRRITVYAFASNKRDANKLKPYKVMALPAFIYESKIWAVRKTS
jgi:hypothetical protein